jgi:hypothetical protein
MRLGSLLLMVSDMAVAMESIMASEIGLIIKNILAFIFCDMLIGFHPTRDNVSGSVAVIFP